MGRDREYVDNAERQRAYRERKKAQEAWLKQELRRADTRKAVSEKLVKVLGMLGSDNAGVRDNAALQATRILKEAGLTWYDVLGMKKGLLKK
jgi:hypothetical protein